MRVDQWRESGEFLEIEGRSIFVIDTGGEKPPLVLLHGYPTSSHDYHLVLPGLAADYRVVVHDHLGFGLSDKPLDYSYSLFEQADIAQLLWQKLGLKQVELFAHDYGTSVATELVARRNIGYEPVELRSLTLCNGSVHIELAKLRFIQKLLRNRTLGPLIAFLSSRRVLSRNMRSIFHDPSTVSNELIADMWTLLTHKGGKKVLPKITQYLRDRELFWHRWVGGLTRTDLPAHILWGSEDPITGRDVAQVHHQEMRDSTLTLLDGVGHYPMLEAPDRWSEALLSWLQGRTN